MRQVPPTYLRVKNSHQGLIADIYILILDISINRSRVIEMTISIIRKVSTKRDLWCY